MESIVRRLSVTFVFAALAVACEPGPSGAPVDRGSIALQDAGAPGDAGSELVHESLVPIARDEYDSACTDMMDCLRAGAFGRGTDNYSLAASCVPPSAPPAFQTCIEYRGGLGCFDRWPGCRAPVGFCDRQINCVRYRGGLSCFAKYPCSDLYDRDRCRLYGDC